MARVLLQLPRLSEHLGNLPFLRHLPHVDRSHLNSNLFAFVVIWIGRILGALEKTRRQPRVLQYVAALFGCVVVCEPLIRLGLIEDGIGLSVVASCLCVLEALSVPQSSWLGAGARSLVVVSAAVQVAFALKSMRQPDGVAYRAHLFGMFVGLLASYKF